MSRMLRAMIGCLSGGIEVHRLQLGLEVVEERQRPSPAAPGGERRSPANGSAPPGRALAPLIGDQQHRLGEVEGGESRVDREGDDGVGERDLVVLEPGPLPPEQDADPLPGPEPRLRLAPWPPSGPKTRFICPRSRAVVAKT